MDYLRFSISNPVKVSVGVILVILSGLLAFRAIPIQLTPDVDTPIITVETAWTGNDPEEVEKEIIQEQEKFLATVQGLKKMTAMAQDGKAEITLEFHLGTDIEQARGNVSDKLREVPEYPPDADEPVVTAADAADANAIAWIVLPNDDPDFDIQGFFDTADKRIKPRLKRVDGVAEINIYGGREREVHIRVDPLSMAQRSITFNQLIEALRRDNVNVSAGQMKEGDKKDVRVRAVNQYDDLETIRQTVIASPGGVPVRINDIGDVILTLEKRRSFVRSRGEPALAFQVLRKVGANVMQTMTDLREVIEDINANDLPVLAPGKQLQLDQVYDETVYIEDAINLVQWSLNIGGGLAVLVLLLFLRTIRPTLIVAMAIPISVIGTFVVMTVMGRNLNVVSLAGLAFAVGMVVDNAIVVLENIDRHLNMGKAPAAAAYDGTREVWGAILAATLTTLVVFLPVIFMQEEAGQLFRDISIAICAAVALSLVVSVTVIPSASARWLRQRAAESSVAEIQGPIRGLFGLVSLGRKLGNLVAGLIHALASPTVGAMGGRIVIVAALTVAALFGAWVLMPPTTYLPQGNRNLVFGVMFNPPGYNIDQQESIGHRVEGVISPYWLVRTVQEALELPPPAPHLDHLPPIHNYFFVSFRGRVFMGASSRDKQNVRPLGELLGWAMTNTVPGGFGMARQTSLFGRGLAGGNAVEVELVGSELGALRQSAVVLLGSLEKIYGRQNLRTQPLNFNLSGEEIQLRLDKQRARDLGVDATAMGQALAALVDGLQIGDYRHEGDSIDLMLIRHPDFPLLADRLGEVPVATRLEDGTLGPVVLLSSFTRQVPAPAPQQINRIEQSRGITITVAPPPEVPLETAMIRIGEVTEQLKVEGRAGRAGIAPGVKVNRGGTADKLTQVRTALLGDWDKGGGALVVSILTSRMFLALLVVYLVMAALFESFLYPLVILFSVPLATVGGFMGLAIVHRIEPLQMLDVLTMLGFVILIGVVVNNAILIVHQTLNFMCGRANMAGGRVSGPLPAREAIRESVRTRFRPIFMTTLTSVCGMLPLVVTGGAGSELYKGLGSVVVGGLLVATIFTLVVVPLLLSVVLDLKSAWRRLLGVSQTP